MVEADVLTVKSVSANHSGSYLCTAMDSTGRSAEKMVEVVVSYPPQVSVSEVVIHALSGDVKSHAWPYILDPIRNGYSVL